MYNIMCVGVTQYKYVIRLLFQVTSKVTHYFLNKKKISELMFQKNNASYVFFPFIDRQVSCPHVRRNGSTEALCALYEHGVTAVDSTKCECALFHLTRKKQIQYSSKLIKIVKCKLRIWRKPAIIKYVK